MLKPESDDSIYAIALMLLFILKDEPSYSTVSQLAFLLDSKSFDKLIDYFGGLTIKIPTREEVNSALKGILYYQERYVNGRSVYESRLMSHITYDDILLVHRNARKINKFFNKLSDNYISDQNDKFR